MASPDTCDRSTIMPSRFISLTTSSPNCVSPPTRAASVAACRDAAGAATKRRDSSATVSTGRSDGSSTTFEPLVQTSENAGPMDASRLRFLTDPNELMTGFTPTGERYALAARVSGPADASVDAPEGAGGEHRASAVPQGINVLLFADTDLLSDRMWVQVQPIFGATAFADNGALAINAVDNMLGNRDLISIRTRATSARPFGRVEAIRVAAERTFRQTEERLQRELEETERRLNELQVNKGEGDLMVISDEQQEEVERFMERRLEIRRELRQVQHDLRRDIDRLDTQIKVINIVVVPTLVMVVALVWAARRRRRQDRPHAEEAA